MTVDVVDAEDGDGVELIIEAEGRHIDVILDDEATRELYEALQSREAGSVDGIADVDDLFPVDCVLCGHTADSHPDHEQHMQEAHDL